jgi:hypothetical protein
MQIGIQFNDEFIIALNDLKNPISSEIIVFLLFTEKITSSTKNRLLINPSRE